MIPVRRVEATVPLDRLLAKPLSAWKVVIPVRRVEAAVPLDRLLAKPLLDHGGYLCDDSNHC